MARTRLSIEMAALLVLVDNRAEFYIEPAQCNLGVYRQIGRGNCSSSIALFIQVLNCVFTRP